MTPAPMPTSSLSSSSSHPLLAPVPLPCSTRLASCPVPLQLPALSASLDGEAVVVFFRALAAISREELELPLPRVHCLQRLVECAHANIGAWGQELVC